jgi:transposase-like protein
LRKALQGLKSDLADEIQKMRQRMARLEEENLILKKAMAIFTKDSRNGLDASED